MTEPTVSADEQAFLNEEASHWGTWRAKSPIYIDGVRAFNPGADVPNGHVDTYHLREQGLVEEIANPDEDAPAEPVEAPQGEPIQGNATVVGSASDDEPIYDGMNTPQQ